ncbi:hypothetical protein L3Q82_025439 [Scortum barcoo]|uniref:Uncharacterized protein n=1 Tax=Scortum barcoo TaxID=214431 RepID=A0ACB8WN68_9TELE|nr:hypothetical protein L3Q82_025439 [Scortum barcoo]
MQFFVRSTPTCHWERGGLPAPRLSENGARKRHTSRHRRGKRAGLDARLKACANQPPLPSLLLANVRSLENKLDELRARITSQREVRDCCALIFTDNLAFSELAGLCDSTTVPLHSPGRPHDCAQMLYTGRRGAAAEVQAILSAEGIQYGVFGRWLHCPAALALLQPSAHFTTSSAPRRQAHPDAAFIIGGDFNHCNLRTVLPKFQHSHKRTEHTGPSDTENILQNCFAQTDCDVFKAAATQEDSSLNIELYAEYVTDYITTCTDNIVPTSQIIKYPNQKPWMNSQVRHTLHPCSLAFRAGDEMEYKSSKYKPRKAIKEAKQLYQQKLEGCYSTDTRRMWQGLQLVTDYKGTTVGISNNSTSLPDELNQFYCHFETHNRETERTHAHTWDRHDPHRLSHWLMCTELSGE